MMLRAAFKLEDWRGEVQYRANGYRGELAGRQEGRFSAAFKRLEIYLDFNGSQQILQVTFCHSGISTSLGVAYDIMMLVWPRVRGGFC
jgi:hypothetical protein